MKTFKIIDPNAIRENMMNNIDIIKQMIPMYLGQGVEDFISLKNAINSEDLADIKAKAHHIKPTMQYLGATELRLKFQKLEDDAFNKEPIENLKVLFEEIKSDFDLAMLELKEFQTSLD